jgi:hypothetical protein
VAAAVCQPLAPPPTRHEVRRLVHVLHATCDGARCVAGEDLERRARDRLRARAAHPVHGHRTGCRLGEEFEIDPEKGAFLLELHLDMARKASH